MSRLYEQKYENVSFSTSHFSPILCILEWYPIPLSLSKYNKKNLLSQSRHSLNKFEKDINDEVNWWWERYAVKSTAELNQNTPCNSRQH